MSEHMTCPSCSLELEAGLAFCTRCKLPQPGSGVAIAPAHPVLALVASDSEAAESEASGGAPPAVGVGAGAGAPPAVVPGAVPAVSSLAAPPSPIPPTGAPVYPGYAYPGYGAPEQGFPGYPAPPYPGYGYPPGVPLPRQPSGFSTTGIVLGCVGVLSPLISLIGLIFAFVALSQGQPRAKAAVVVSGVGFVLSVAIAVVAFLVLGSSLEEL